MFLVFLIFFSGSMKICHLYILSVMSDEYSYFCYHQGEKKKKKKNRSFIMHVHAYFVHFVFHVQCNYNFCDLHCFVGLVVGR